MNRLWYKKNPLCWALFPISVIYGLISWLRRFYLTRYQQTTFAVPIIVVGNLTVGGVGKTPLVIAIAHALKEKGIHVGIVSRGYGARGPFPREVTPEDNPDDVGDEPLLIRRKTACPLVIAPDRVSAVRYLLSHHAVQVIISDDGLQHYALGRAIEIVVIDGTRGFGNALLFPAGPLREYPSRLNTVDFVVVNGGEWGGAYRMAMRPGQLTSLLTGKIIEPALLKEPVAAVAAIGNPDRFYQTLASLNITYRPYSFADHHRFTPSDLQCHEAMMVMTEKDAVKCISFGTDNMLVSASELT